MNRRLRVLQLVLAVSVPVLLGAGGGNVDTRISRVAIAYAQSFEPLLRSEPTEAERFGIAADDLARLEVAAVHPLQTVDPRFRAADDARDVSQALVATDLWWVVLSVDATPRLVVSVQWPEGAADPQAVGLGWVPAAGLAAALAQVDDRGASVVYLPEDASFVLGQVDGSAVAMPIASEALSARLQLPKGPVPVAEYTRSLRQRLDRLAELANDEVSGLSWGGGSPTTSGGSSGGVDWSVLALVTLHAPLGLLALTAVVPIQKSPRHLPGRRDRR